MRPLPGPDHLEAGADPAKMTILNSRGILYDNGKRDRVQLELIKKVNPENRRMECEKPKGGGFFTKCICQVKVDTNKKS